MRKGYKYIIWNMQNENADTYLSKIEKNEPIHYAELALARGSADTEEMNGIYFCETLPDLYHWLKVEIDWGIVDAVEILEVIPLDEVKEKVYPQFENRKAYVCEKVKCRILKDEELTQDLITLMDERQG